jgi:hypothetical protein
VSTPTVLQAIRLVLQRKSARERRELELEAAFAERRPAIVERCQMALGVARSEEEQAKAKLAVIVVENETGTAYGLRSDAQTAELLAASVKEGA